MQKDKFLYISLAIGFFIVGLVFFYEDYSSAFGFGNNSSNPSYQNQMDRDLPPDDMNDDQLPATTPGRHVVKVDETAYRIASQYGLTVSELIALNPTKIVDTGNKSDDGQPIYNIQVGAKLNVDKTDLNATPDAGTSQALKKASDFLAQIEKKCKESYCPYKASEVKKHQDALAKLENNSLASRLLSDMKRILDTYHSNGLRKDQYNLTRHSYKKGESVYDIAKRYGVRPPDIQRYNPQKVKAKIKNGVPVVDAQGRAQYEIVEGSKLIVFEKKPE